MRYRPGAFRALTAALALTVLPGAKAPAGDVSATVTGLRSEKGLVLACLTAEPESFPACDKDPAARAIRVPAAQTVELDFGPVPAGRYAIAIIHDENANGRLDKRLMLPREGFGFSRDAPVSFGPPRFDAAAFSVSGQDRHHSIRMRYLL